MECITENFVKALFLESVELDGKLHGHGEYGDGKKHKYFLDHGIDLNYIFDCINFNIFQTYTCCFYYLLREFTLICLVTLIY